MLKIDGHFVRMGANMGLLNINNVDMPKPTSYQVGVQDLDSAETVRSESGILHRDRVRAGVRKISVSWTVKAADISKILKAVQNESCTVKFFDPQENSVKTATMYAGDRVPTLSVQTNENDTDNTWWDLSFDLVEF